ncbi:MAG: carboxypeptidase-like regulatory domain-containing protein [Flavobacteriales bacterium]|nr:carboxypeptidase-like regulatory domain-containing protein [Flavobacteriales bacterium]
MKYCIVFTVLFISVLTGFGQKDPSEGLLQLSGVVVSGDSLTPVPFSSILIEGSSRGTICDYYGFFSLVVREGDTILFSSVGYRSVEFVVPDTLQSKRYSIIQLLQKDTITLPEQKVYPWPSKEQFEQAFLTLNAPTDDFDRAFENMTREDVRLAVQGVPMSAQGNYNYVVQQEYTRLYNQGLLPQISLLNPLAWAQFIQAWKKGEFKSDK